MKFQSDNMNGKRGGVMAMAMIVLLIFSVLAIGLFKLRETDAVETVYMKHSKQAFWHAETGLQDAIQRLKCDNSFRSQAIGGSASFTVNNLATSQTVYNVTVTDTLGGSPSVASYEFNIVSVGWEGSMNRRIRQMVNTFPGLEAAIWAGGSIKVAANTLITKPIIVMGDGELILDDKIPKGQSEEGDFDIVVLADEAFINLKKSGANEGADYDVIDIPAPPDFPVFPDYSSQYNLAVLQPVTNGVVNLGTIDLGGITHYYNMPDGIIIEKITGGGTIVNTGSIEITQKSSSDTSINVAVDTTILSWGKVNIGQMNEFGGNTVIYADETVDFGGFCNATRKSAIFAKGTGLTPTQTCITMGGQSQFEGMVYAYNGIVVVEAGSGGDNNTRITGTVVSRDGVDVRSNTEIIFDRDAIDSKHYPPGQVIVTKGTNTWEELPPLDSK